MAGVLTTKINFMESILVTLPTIEQIEFTVEAQPEDTPVRGNAIASGDEAYDKQVEDGIISRLHKNQWAWCCVKVTGTYKGLSAEDYLGSCSYKNEKDFKKDGYYNDMCDTVYRDIVGQLRCLATG